MPFLNVNNTQIFYKDFGDPNANEIVVFAHGLLWDHEMFLPQINHLKANYRCIAFDFRGQGQSESTPSGYDMDSLTDDTLKLIEALTDKPVHFLGLSMGGFIGMRLAVRHPDKLESLMLLETTADPEPEENKPKYRKLAFFAKWFGLRMIVGKTMPIMFSQSFLTDPKRQTEKLEWTKRMLKLNRWTIGRAVYGVVDRQGIYEELPKIKTPTLIIVGDEDVATVPEKANRMHAAIAHSQLKIVEKAGHTSSIEQPKVICELVEAFLSGVSHS